MIRSVSHGRVLRAMGYQANRIAILRDLVEHISILRDQEILIKQLAPSYRLLTYAQRDRPGIGILFLCKDYYLAAKRQYAFDDLVHVHRERHLLLISLDNHIKTKHIVPSYGFPIRRVAGLRPWFWCDSHAPVSMSLLLFTGLRLNRHCELFEACCMVVRSPRLLPLEAYLQ